MPKVRASSGMIGTMRRPKPSVRARARRSRVKAVVVDAACLPEPASSSVKASSGGRVRGRLTRTTRLGSEPPRAVRRSIR